MEVIALNSNHDNQHTNLLREALASSSIGWEIALPIGGGVLLGQVIDRATGTDFVFTILGLFFGVFSGFYNLTRHVQRINANKTVTRGKPISDEEWDSWDDDWEEDDWAAEIEEEQE